LPDLSWRPIVLRWCYVSLLTRPGRACVHRLGDIAATLAVLVHSVLPRLKSVAGYVLGTELEMMALAGR